eukprot:1157267-Pelagomonas_calceolata.AAC.6
MRRAARAGEATASTLAARHSKSLYNSAQRVRPALSSSHPPLQQPLQGKPPPPRLHNGDRV